MTTAYKASGAPSPGFSARGEDHQSRGLISRLRQLLAGIGADRALSYAAMENVVAIAMGAVTAVLVATRFTRVMQGYYYSFAGLAIIPTVAELGLGQALIQFASH